MVKKMRKMKMTKRIKWWNGRWTMDDDKENDVKLK
jgi:hypothetical protein